MGKRSKTGEHRGREGGKLVVGEEEEEEEEEEEVGGCRIYWENGLKDYAGW